MRAAHKQGVKWLFFCMVFLGTVVYFHLRISELLTNDGAAEMVLGKLLYRTRTLITRDWYYSTELRVLDQNNLYSILFFFTESWHQVRVVSYILLYAMVSASCWYFCCQFPRLRADAPVCMAFLLIPFTMEECWVFLQETFYIKHVFFSFLGMGLLFHTMRTERIGLRRRLLAAQFIAAFIADLPGPRLLALLYFPLLCSVLLNAVWKKERRGIASAAAALAGGVSGYAVNYGLIHYGGYHVFRFTELELGLDPGILPELLRGLFEALGYHREDAAVCPLIGRLLAVLLLIVTGLAVYRLWRVGDWMEGILVLYILLALAVFIGIYLMVQIRFKHSYYLLLTIYVVPLLLLCRHQVRKKTGWLLGVLLSALIVGNGISVYASQEDVNQERKMIVDYLIESGLTQGYATLWNSSILTELSDGVIEVWNVALHKPDETGAVISIDGWLQEVRHGFSYPEEPHSFLLLSWEEYEELRAYLPELSDAYTVQTNSYVLFEDAIVIQ